MVVLSSAIVTSGKTLVARQFVEMTRLRVEGLLSAFPKLLSSERDHTFIETETIRYVYQPIASLYLLLITDKSSNILEDLETLRLLANVLQDCCQVSVTEELVLKHAFDIVFAFDEVISFGLREGATLSQIKTYTGMESHEEKITQMIEDSKIEKARKVMEQKQMEFARRQRTHPKGDQLQMERPSNLSTQQEAVSVSGGAIDTVNDSMTRDVPLATWSNAMGDDRVPVLKPAAPTKGMVLKPKGPIDLLASFGVVEPASISESAAASAEEKPAAAVNPLLDAVVVDIEEKVTAALDVDGGLSGDVTCRGSFSVTVMDAAKAALVAFKLAPQDKAFKCKVHPNLNKASHENNVLEVRDVIRAYRENAPLAVVTWHLKSTDEAFLPMSLSCWPTPTADGTHIILELTLEESGAAIDDITVLFRAPPSAQPVISNAEPGNASVSSREIRWYIPRMESTEATATLEFTAKCNQACLLPFIFEATQKGVTRCPMNILECYHMERKEAVSFTCQKASTYQLTCGSC